MFKLININIGKSGRKKVIFHKFNELNFVQINATP